MKREPYEVPDQVLLRRAATNARSTQKRKGVRHPRWVAVMDLFCVGRTYAQLICHHYGLDPDEEVSL